jgi:hypothetical protein
MSEANLNLDGTGQCVHRNCCHNVGQRSFSLADVIELLKVEPELGRRSGEPGEAHGHFRRDRGRAGKNPMKRLPGDAQFSGSLAYGQVETWKDPVAEDEPGVPGRSAKVRLFHLRLTFLR